VSAVGKAITAHKLDEAGREVWRYQGTLLETSATHVILEASFDHDRVEVGGLILMRGDRFVEEFYTDRWYNIFRIYDGESGTFKGWYCNICRPARIEPGHVYAEDLALDLVVAPGGRWRVVDQDEFQALSLSGADRRCAISALKKLQRLASAQEEPFSWTGPPGEE
jgi:predicted RNA-binding protein associated with RNAse of E/G family